MQTTVTKNSSSNVDEGSMSITSQLVQTYLHFTKLTVSNLKQPHFEIPLGKLTVICGEEASYKTAHADAMQLALTGQHRIGKNPSDLARLAYDETLPIIVHLEGASGSATWKLEINPETGKHRKPSAPHFEGKLAQLSDDERYCILPSLSVRDLLSSAKGERKLREALIRRFGSGKAELPELLVSSVEEQAMWLTAVEECKKSNVETSSDSLLASLTEFFRRSSLAKRKEITQLENFLAQQKTLVAQSTIGAEQLPVLQRQLEKAKAWENSTSLREELKRVVTELDSLQPEVANLEAELATKKTTYEQKKQVLDNISTSAKEVFIKEKVIFEKESSRFAALNLVIAQYRTAIDMSQTELGKCPFCANKEARITDTFRMFESRREDSKKEVEVLAARMREAEEAYLHDINTLAEYERVQLKIVASDEARCQSVRSRFAPLAARQLELNAKLSDCPKSYSGPPVGELSHQIETLKLAANARVRLQKDSMCVRALEAEYDAMKRLEKQAEEMQKQMMKDVAARASQEVSECMLDDRSAILDSVSCEWTVIGRDKRAHIQGAMCGTEETALLLAMYEAWTRGAPFRFPVFDDRDLVGLSKKGMADFFYMCERAVSEGRFTQCVVICNRQDEAPLRWHRILCDVQQPLRR